MLYIGFGQLISQIVGGFVYLVNGYLLNKKFVF